MAEVVGVPEITIALAFQTAVKPGGNPVGMPIPVAPVVENVTTGFNGAFTHTAGLEDGALTVFPAMTEMIPVALTFPQPPVSGME